MRYHFFTLFLEQVFPMWKINKISRHFVGTTSPATSLSRLDLTPWDLQMIQLPPIQRALIFPKPQSQKMDQNFIHHLTNSLSRTLDYFPPLAGRLATTASDNGTASFFVDCNNQGVEFTHAAAADVSVSDILETDYIPEIIYSFFPLNDYTSFEGISKPLLAVQLTELADGLVIACTANHAVVDGTSFWHFFNSWSEISRGFDTISKPPVFSRSIFPTGGVPPLEQNPWHKSVPPPLLKRVFHFSRESLAKLKSKASSEAGTDKISSFQALSALLWRTTTRIQQNPSSGEVGFVLIVGARSRMIGLGDGYFGNAVYACAISASERELLQNGIGYASLKINELVGQQTSEAAMEDLKISENRLLMRKVCSFFIVGSPRYNVYGNDFGWGKPIAARSGKERDVDGKMTVLPAAECGGVDLEVCLATEKLLAMEDDSEFMAALTV